MSKFRNLKQLSLKESLKLQDELYYWKTQTLSKEKTIQGLIDRMIDLENDLKYEVKLNSILQEKNQANVW